MTTPAKHKPDCPMHPNWTDETLVRGLKSCTCGTDKPTPPLPDDVQEAFDMATRMAAYEMEEYGHTLAESSTILELVAHIQAQAECIAGLESDCEMHLHDRSLADRRADLLQAQVERMVEWARGRCECCKHTVAHAGHCHRYFRGADGHCTSWTPDLGHGGAR